MNPIRLYRFALSGHCHRVELMLSLLGLTFENVDVDLKAKEQKTPEFLRKNPLGLVPVIEDGAITIADSNAILVYLATRYDTTGRWYPREAAASARVQQWLSLAFGAAAARPRSPVTCWVTSNGTCKTGNSSPANIRPSRTSRCIRTPRTRPRVESRSRRTRRSAAGWRASRRCRGSCRCGSRPLPHEPALMSPPS